MANPNTFNIDDILTIPNGGGIIDKDGRKHSNACMWISVKNYLQVFKNIDIDVGELKNRANLPPDENDSEFDMEQSNHMTGLQRITQCYNLCVEIYIYDRRGERLLRDHVIRTGNCPGDPNVKIISYGRHFELFILKTEINMVREQYKKIFKVYNRKVKSITGEYAPLNIQNMSEKEQLDAVLAFSKKDHGSVSDPGGGAGKSPGIQDDDPDLAKALQESRDMQLRKRKFAQPAEYEEDEELRKALENSLHDQRENLELHKVIEESKQSARNHFFELSRKYSDLQNVIDNYNFNIRSTEAEATHNTDDPQLYATIIGDLTEKLKEFKTEQAQLLNEMHKLQEDIYELLGGGSRGDDYNRRKYLKYKNKYIQLKNKK